LKDQAIGQPRPARFCPASRRTKLPEIDSGRKALCPTSKMRGHEVVERCGTQAAAPDHRYDH
jgi:hypothetical protein